MTKGDIVLIPFPFTNLTGSKNRPAVVLVATAIDITVAFVTSQLKWQEEFDFKVEPSFTNGIKVPSLIRLSKLATIDRDLVIGKLGSLNSDEIKVIDLNLLKLFQIYHR